MRYLVRFGGTTNLFRIATAPTPDEAVKVALREISDRDMVFPITVNPIDDETTYQYTASVEYKVSQQGTASRMVK